MGFLGFCPPRTLCWAWAGVQGLSEEGNQAGGAGWVGGCPATPSLPQTDGWLDRLQGLSPRGAPGVASQLLLQLARHRPCRDPTVTPAPTAQRPHSASTCAVSSAAVDTPARLPPQIRSRTCPVAPQPLLPGPRELPRGSPR